MVEGQCVKGRGRRRRFGRRRCRRRERHPEEGRAEGHWCGVVLASRDGAVKDGGSCKGLVGLQEGVRQLPLPLCDAVALTVSVKRSRFRS